MHCAYDQSRSTTGQTCCEIGDIRHIWSICTFDQTRCAVDQFYQSRSIWSMVQRTWSIALPGDQCYQSCSVWSIVQCTWSNVQRDWSSTVQLVKCTTDLSSAVRLVKCTAHMTNHAAQPVKHAARLVKRAELLINCTNGAAFCQA